LGLAEAKGEKCLGICLTWMFEQRRAAVPKE